VPKISIYLNENNNKKLNEARGPLKKSTVINKILEVLDIESIRSWCGLSPLEANNPTQTEQVND